MSASFRSASVSSESGRTRARPERASRDSVMYSGLAGIVSRTVLAGVDGAPIAAESPFTSVNLLGFYRKFPNLRSSLTRCIPGIACR